MRRAERSKGGSMRDDRPAIRVATSRERHRVGLLHSTGSLQLASRAGEAMRRCEERLRAVCVAASLRLLSALCVAFTFS